MPPPPDEIVMDVDVDLGLDAKVLLQNIDPPSNLGGIFDDVPMDMQNDPTDTAATIEVPMPKNMPTMPSMDWGADTLGQDLVGAFSASPTAAMPAPPRQPLPIRLRSLAEHLRAEGRADDADDVQEAIDALKLT